MGNHKILILLNLGPSFQNWGNWVFKPKHTKNKEKKRKESPGFSFLTSELPPPPPRVLLLYQLPSRTTPPDANPTIGAFLPRGTSPSLTSSSRRCMVRLLAATTTISTTSGRRFRAFVWRHNLVHSGIQHSAVSSDLECGFSTNTIVSFFFRCVSLVANMLTTSFCDVRHLPIAV